MAECSAAAHRDGEGRGAALYSGGRRHSSRSDGRPEAYLVCSPRRRLITGSQWLSRPSLAYKTVLWTIDTVDWQRPAPTTIIDRFLWKAWRIGALVPDASCSPTVEALPIIVDQLRQRGFRLVTVGELLARLGCLI